jgi:tetratricopeptide (TPR) repeat protein
MKHHSESVSGRIFGYVLGLVLSMAGWPSMAESPCTALNAGRLVEAIQSTGYKPYSEPTTTLPVSHEGRHPFGSPYGACIMPTHSLVSPTQGGTALWLIGAYLLDYAPSLKKTLDRNAIDAPVAVRHGWNQSRELALTASNRRGIPLDEFELGADSRAMVTGQFDVIPWNPLPNKFPDAQALMQCGNVLLYASWKQSYSPESAREFEERLKGLTSTDTIRAQHRQRDEERRLQGKRELRQWAQAMNSALNAKGACVYTDESTPPSSGTYATEWVWIMSVYEARLNQIAGALTKKHRLALGIPDSREISVAEWLNVDTDINVIAPDAPAELYERNAHQKIISRSQAQAARAEFKARKQVLDEKLAESYRRWVEAVNKGDSAANVALWQAADDLRRLRAALYGAGKNPLGGMLVDSAVKILEAGIAQFFKQGPKYTDMVNVEMLLGKGRGARLIGLVDDKAWEKLADKAEDTVKEQFSASFRQVIGAGDPKQIDNLADKLVRWADVMLDEVAYPRPRLPDDYRQLGVNPFFNIGFSLNFLPEDELVARRFGRRAACMRKEIGPARRIDLCAPEPIDAFKIAELQAGASLTGYGGESPLTTTQYKEVLTRANIVGFDTWLREIDDIRRDTRAKAAAGEQLWFQRLNEANPARRLSALRLLAADLRRVIEDSFERKVKKWAIETLSKKLVGATVPMLKPLGNFAQLGVTGAVDYFAPDNLARFVEDLDRASLEVAKQVAAPPRIDLVLPNRDADLDRLMAVSASLPPSAQTPPPAPAQRAAPPESATPPSPAGAKSQAEIHARRAVELADAEKWPEAEGEYRRALALSPDMDDLWSSLAESLGAQGKWAEAGDALRQAVRLVPKEANYRRELANALRKQGRLDEARREEAEAARLERDN